MLVGGGRVQDFTQHQIRDAKQPTAFTIFSCMITKMDRCFFKWGQILFGGKISIGKLFVMISDPNGRPKEAKYSFIVLFSYIMQCFVLCHFLLLCVTKKKNS